MSSQLNALFYSRFLTSEALTYTEQTLPLFRQAATGNPFLTGIVDKIGSTQKSIIEIINRATASALTPVAQKMDLARTDTISGLNSYFDSKIKRVHSQPEQAHIAETLSALLSQKCPEFYHCNDVDQTVAIDALKTEMEKNENKQLAEQIGATELFTDLFTFNEKYKSAVKGRTEENDAESPKVRNLCNKMMKNVALMHSNLGELMEQNPGTLSEIAQKINAFNAEMSARVRARLTRELNKGTTDAIVVEPEAVTQ
jgi:hypothetical protein